MLGNIVNNLRVDVLVRAKNSQAGAFGRARNFLAQSFVATFD
jgi:hypothetical protein